jgi:hypothetical protein
MASIAVKTRVQWRDEIGRYAQRVDDGAEEAQGTLSQLGATLAAALAPRKRGVLAGSIHSTGHGFATGALPHALPQEEGAGAHPIGAPGQTLGNKEEGFGPVKGPVLHSGNPAVHYMRNALRLLKPRIMPTIRSKMP